MKQETLVNETMLIKSGEPNYKKDFSKQRYKQDFSECFRKERLTDLRINTAFHSMLLRKKSEKLEKSVTTN